MAVGSDLCSLIVLLKYTTSILDLQLGTVCNLSLLREMSNDSFGVI